MFFFLVLDKSFSRCHVLFRYRYFHYLCIFFRSPTRCLLMYQHHFWKKEENKRMIIFFFHRSFSKCPWLSLTRTKRVWQRSRTTEKPWVFWPRIWTRLLTRIRPCPLCRERRSAGNTRSVLRWNLYKKPFNFVVRRMCKYNMPGCKKYELVRIIMILCEMTWFPIWTRLSIRIPLCRLCRERKSVRKTSSLWD